MKSHSFFTLLAGFIVLTPFQLNAAQIVCQGVIGNSGEQGSTLVRFGTTPVTGMGIVYDAPTESLWARAGDGVLNRYALDGRLRATYPIPKQVPTSSNDRLIRLGNRLIMTVGGKLYALPIDAPAGTAPTPLKVDADLISASSYNGSIAIASSPDRTTWQISLYNPDTGKTTPLVADPLAKVRQIELLPNGDLVVHIPGSTLGDSHVNGMHELHLFHNGKEVTDGWPRPSPGEHLQYLDNYWYGAFWHGTLRRFNANLEPDPGVVLGGGSGAFIGHVDQNEEVGVPWGPVKLRDGLYAVSGVAGIVHIIQWDKPKLQFSIVRRIGAIQNCRGIAVNHQGDIWYNSGLWRWNDPPDMAQHEGSAPIEMGQAVILPNDRFTAPILRGGPGVMGGNFTWNNAFSDLKETTPKSGFLNGSAVYKNGKGGLILLAIDRTGKSRSYRVDSYNGRGTESLGEVALETASPVKEWTALTMKDADTLLGAGDGFVIEMARDGANWKETRRWNTVLDGTFGSRIYLTADAGRLWISDTDNHRILCFQLADGTFIASFGNKREAGADLTHLDSPRVIAARDNRIVVFDSGNQRLVKLSFSENR